MQELTSTSDADMTTAGRASLGAARTAMPVGAKDMQSTTNDSMVKGDSRRDSEVSNHNIPR